MSISEQVKELREFEIGWLHDVPMAKGIMKQAADTIESLSAKLADMERSAEDKNSWQPISEYNREKYDWVLIKYFDGEEECVPQVAELRSDGKWHVSTDFDGDVAIPPWFDVRYFFDMQQLDNHEP